MNVLIIGGTKYFGKVIAQRLLARGDNVTLFTRGNTRPEFWSHIDHIAGDRTDHERFVELLRGRSFDAVIDNLAFRVEDVQAVIKALNGRTEKYLFTSTVSTYGGPGHALLWTEASRRDEPLWVDEFVDLQAHCPLREDDLDLGHLGWEYSTEIDEYAQGKRQIERYLHETLDFPWVVMRVPATMGPEDPSLRFWWYMQRVLDGREMLLRDGGSNIFRLGFRDDVAQAFIDAMDSPNTVRQTYNICQDEVATLLRFLRAMAKAAGRRLNVVSVPGDAAESLTDLPWHDWAFDPFSRPAAYVMSISKARRDFGLHNTPMVDWVRQTVDWYSENHDGADSAFYDRRDDEVEFARWWRDQHARLVESGRKRG